MNNPSVQYFAPHISPWKLLVITLVSSIMGFQLIGILIGAVVALPFYDGNLVSLFASISDPLNNPEVKVPFMITQGVGSAFGMIFIPWLIYTKLFKLPLNFGQTKATIQPILFTFLIVIFFMVVNSPVGEWNQNIKLPSSLSSIEQALQSMPLSMVRDGSHT